MADRILLNIGGDRFETSRDTLTRVPGTLFYWYCTGRLEMEPGDDGSIFFDRDPSHFEHILAFLEDGTLAVAGPTERPSVGLLLYLRREFSYYGIRVAVSLPSEVLDSVALILLSHELDNDGDAPYAGRPLAATSMRRVLPVKAPAHIAFAYCVVGRDALYMSGGFKCGEPVSRQVDKFDSRSELWTTVALMPEPLKSHSAVAVGRDLYIIGGRTSRGECSREVFVLATETLIWSRAPPLPVGRFDAAACSFGQSIYVFGGRNDGGARVESMIQLPQVFIFDTVANTWSTAEEMPILRSFIYMGPDPRRVMENVNQPERCYRLSATLVGGLIYITGGPQLCVLRYDPTAIAGNNAWSHCPPSRLQHITPSLGLRPVPFAFNGRLILLCAGGVVEEYVPAGEYWSTLPSFSAGGPQLYVQGAAVVGEPFTPEEEETELFSSLISSAVRRDRVARLADIDLTVDSDSDYTTEDNDEGES